MAQKSLILHKASLDGLEDLPEELVLPQVLEPDVSQYLVCCDLDTCMLVFGSNKQSEYCI